MENLPVEAALEEMEQLHIGFAERYSALKANSMLGRENDQDALHMTNYTDFLFVSKMEKVVDDHATQYFRKGDLPLA
jgi:hypothetical protein